MKGFAVVRTLQMLVLPVQQGMVAVGWERLGELLPPFAALETLIITSHTDSLLVPPPSLPHLRRLFALAPSLRRVAVPICNVPLRFCWLLSRADAPSGSPAPTSAPALTEQFCALPADLAAVFKCGFCGSCRCNGDGFCSQ